MTLSLLISTDPSLVNIDKKHVLSIFNDFENGSWRHDRFHRFIWNNIKGTALSYKERQACIGEGEASVLIEAAKKLRLTDSENDIGRGSELAEIVLYGIMKNHYNALPVVPKIFYKQNRQDNAKVQIAYILFLMGKKGFLYGLGNPNSIVVLKMLDLIRSLLQ